MIYLVLSVCGMLLAFGIFVIDVVDKADLGVILRDITLFLAIHGLSCEDISHKN